MNGTSAISTAPLVDSLDALRSGMTRDEADAATLPLLHSQIAPDEERVSFVRRWIDFFGSHDLGGRTGVQVLAWMTGQLLQQHRHEFVPEWNRGNRLIYSWRDAERARAACAEVATRITCALDVHDRRADDVERMGGATDRVATARQISRQHRDFLERARTDFLTGIDESIDALAVRDKEARIEDAGRWSVPDPTLLKRKPTPASINGWFKASYQGKEVWTNGHIVDLAGEPHLKGWQDRMGMSRIPGLSVDKLILEGPRRTGTMLGCYDLGSKRNLMAFAFGDDVVAFDICYLRYFASRHSAIELVDQGDSLSHLVLCAGSLVGVIAAWRGLDDKSGPIRTRADVEARFQMATQTPEQLT